MSEKKFTVTGRSERLDKFLVQRLEGFSRTQVQRLIKEKRVSVNGSPQPARHLVEKGQVVNVSMPAFTSLPAAAGDALPLLYEDENLLVINKPAGLVVHPAGPHKEGTVVQLLWPKLAAGWTDRSFTSPRPGVVHRLDRGTSGVMALAKTPAAAENLSRQFEKRTVEKIYWALLHGIPTTQQGRVRSHVGRSRQSPNRMSVDSPGRLSETLFSVLARFPKKGERGMALVEVHPLTGRTHQIRVQLTALGHPLVGDALYGATDGLSERPLLHALSLSLDHPQTGRRMRWNAPLAQDFQDKLKELGWEGPSKTSAETEGPARPAN